MSDQEKNLKEVEQEANALIAKAKSLWAMAKKSPITAIITAIMFFGPSTALTWIATTWEEAVHDAVISGIRNENSDIHKEIIEVVKKEAKKEADSLVTIRTAEAIEDPAVWAKVLNNTFVNTFAEQKVSEVEQAVDKELARRDSSKSFIEVIGRDIGIRDEDVIPLFSKLMKLFKEGKIATSRHVSVDF